MTENVTTAPGIATGLTRTLLTCGVVAGPLYIVVVVLQMLTRDGFDISRHPASMLSNGEQGWIQIATFAVSGLLFVACVRPAVAAGRPSARLGVSGQNE